MLSTLHNRAYQDFLSLLTDLSNLIVNSQPETNFIKTKLKFEKLKQWFEQNIARLDEADIAPAYIPRWQAIQREINREFKLLTTDVLFLASARQDTTKNKRLKSIANRLDKLKGYCQGLLEETSIEE